VTALPRHVESVIETGLAPAEAFARLDDHRRLAAHMQSRSPMLAGSSMRIETDAQQGRGIGSRIRLSGQVLGLELFVEEAVVEYLPPRRKVWQTTGEPRLLVIGRYRMGFEVQPCGVGSRVGLWIDYELPRVGVAWLGRRLGRFYARWCTSRMLDALAPT
jgi:hypothetical protein